MEEDTVFLRHRRFVNALEFTKKDANNNRSDLPKTKAPARRPGLEHADHQGRLFELLQNILGDILVYHEVKHLEFHIVLMVEVIATMAVVS
jgi:hypothetical protein